MPPQLRPMTVDDAEAVFAVQVAAFGDLDRRFGRPESPPPADPEPGLRRIRHLAETDPAGAWVTLAEDGTIDGAALALIRDGVWGLSLLVVAPGRQSGGSGSALLRATLEYAEGTRGAIIVASEDARALRAYSRAGFAMRPVMDAAGPIKVRPAFPESVRPGRWPEDAAVVDAVSRHVRGATHARDVPNYLASGSELLIHEDGGWAAHDRGSFKVVAARTEAAAADLVRAGLSRTPESRDAAVGMIDAGNDWAVRVVLEAGLALRPSGAIFVRGEVGPLRPYLPSGAYL